MQAEGPGRLVKGCNQKRPLLGRLLAVASAMVDSFGAEWVAGAGAGREGLVLEAPLLGRLLIAASDMRGGCTQEVPLPGRPLTAACAVTECTGAGLVAATGAVEVEGLDWPLPANLLPGAWGRREGCLEGLQQGMPSSTDCVYDILTGSRAGR